ncbi:MAG: stage V sporulation T C-terminal domain-containing protein [Oscillospiraceae bacterium]
MPARSARPSTRPFISLPSSPTGTASSPWLVWFGGNGWRNLSPLPWRTSWNRVSSIEHQAGAAPFLVTESKSGLFVSLAAPIIAQGDVLGCLLLADTEGSWVPGETERTLLETISGFLGRHMEG